MDLRKLKTIIDLFENSTIAELEITEGEEKVRLVKNQVAQVVVSPAELASPLVTAPQAESLPVVVDAAAADNLVRLESPMVGTYHSRSSADEEPFVTVNGHVTEGDTVCIIEAMKLFNSVTAPVTGTVRSMVIANEQPVGFGDLIMLIEPD